MTGMEGIFDDDDDMLIQASSKVAEDGDNFVDNDDDDADSIDLGAIKKSMMPLIMGDEDSNAAGLCGVFLKKKIMHFNYCTELLCAIFLSLSCSLRKF